MKLNIDDATKLSHEILFGLGFSEAESYYITENLIEAEKSGKKSHGLSKLPVIKQVLGNPLDKKKRYLTYINMRKDEDIICLSQSANHLYIDAKYKTGYYAISKSLEEAIPMAQKTSIFAVGIKNLGFSSGYIGAYADKASRHGLVYIGFHNSSGGLNYFGSKEDPLGTNPITVALPSTEYQTIVDASMAALNWSDIEVAKRENSQLPAGTAIDNNGDDTTNPYTAFAVKSIANHKGTALAYAVELLAGALTGSRVGFSQQGGWGSFFILINPAYFVGLDTLQRTVADSNESIKQLSSVSEVFVPGERSAAKKMHNESTGYIEVSQTLLENLKTLHVPR